MGGLQGGFQNNQRKGKRGRPKTAPGYNPTSLSKPRQPSSQLFSSRATADSDQDQVQPRRNSDNKRNLAEVIKMSREDPVIIPDDDEPVLSINPTKKSAERIKHDQEGLQRPQMKRDRASSISIQEYTATEQLINPRRGASQPRNEQQFQTDDVFALEDEEYFTKKAALQRRRDEEKSLTSQATPNPKSPTDAQTNQARSKFTAADGKKRNSRIESPDVLQGDSTVRQSSSPLANQSKQRRKSNSGQRETGSRSTAPSRPQREKFVKGTVIYHFRAESIIIEDSESYLLTWEQDRLAIYRTGSTLSSDPICHFPLDSIISATDGGRTVQLKLRKPPAMARIAYIDFHTPKDAVDLTMKMAHEIPGVKLLHKEEDWVGRAEDLHSVELEKERARRHQVLESASRTQLSASRVQERTRQSVHISPRENQTGKRFERDLHNYGRSTQPDGQNSRKPLREMMLPASDRNSIEDTAFSTTGTEELALPMGEQRPKRMTRASRGDPSASLEVEDPVKKIAVPFSQTGGLGPVWQKPLTYPKTGKKRAEVEFRDLERLDDHEFLNDNLIGFFLRFLEADIQKQRPELAQQIYFFNTYFFATLTNTSKTKKGINYEGVQKWTRGNNIFEHDFIIVPINENAHWYVAIVCNLPQLLSGSEEAEEVEVVENPQPPISASENLLPPKATRIVRRVEDPANKPPLPEDKIEDLYTDPKVDETDRSFQDLNLADEDAKPEVKSDVNANGSLLQRWTEKADSKLGSSSQGTPRKSAKSKRAARRSGVGLQKYDVKAPMIITMDSLGLGRSPTTKALREYIVEEAKSKLELDIDGQQIRGMTAKGIPNQENYSDCGLFLLAYMEKFILDPYLFVGSILERKLNERTDWPVMESHDLRNRLRQFVLAFHESQETGDGTPPAVPIGRILLGEPRPRTPPMDGTNQAPMIGTISKYFSGSSSPRDVKVDINQDVAQTDARQATQAPGSTSDDIGNVQTQEPESAITIESDPSNPTQADTLAGNIQAVGIDPDVSEDLEEMLFEADGDKEETGKYVRAPTETTLTESFMSGIIDAAEEHDADGRHLGNEVAESEQEDDFDELLPASARQ